MQKGNFIEFKNLTAEDFYWGIQQQNISGFWDCVNFILLGKAKS